MKSRKTLHARSRMALLAVSALALGAAAQAQAQAQDAASNEESGEIIVTAQKRAQSTLDVGITLSVAGSEALAIKRIEAVTDLVSFTPNVSVRTTSPALFRSLQSVASA